MNNTENLVAIANKNGWTAEYDASLAKNPNLFNELFSMLTSIMKGLIENFFKRTKQVSLEPTADEFNVKRDLKKFLALKSDGGKLDWLDDDIIGWFGKTTIKGRKQKIVSNIYRLLKNLTHQSIIDTGKKFDIYKKYNLFDAIELASKLIDAGEIEEKGKGIVIYFEEEHDGVPCRVSVCRDDGGKLCLNLLEVDPDREFDVGGGVLFS
ncbi:MAG: hypothetical protein KBB62_00840 [Candidatus Pacebacteria bacterium]|nr:hypothetical protein [Candidatus Paceibacterota bacterium]